MKRFAPLILLLLTMVVHGRSVFYPFLEWDDGAYVTGNPRVMSGGAETWPAIWNPRPAFHGERPEYLPVLETSHRLIRIVTGSGAWGFHAANLLVHAAAAFAFLLLLVRLRLPPEAAFWASALFVVHPLHVESVAWVSGLKDPLSSLFLFLALRAFLDRRLTSLLFLLLALGTKGTAVVFVPLALLCEWMSGERSISKSLVRLIPHALLVGLSVAVTMVVARANGVVKADLEGNTFLTMVTVLVGYVQRLFVPSGLSAHYKPLPVFSVAEPRLLLSAALLAAAAVLVAWFGRKHRWVLFSVLWFFLSLLPVLNFVPISTQMADRYLYVALGGFAAFLGWGLAGRGMWGRAVLAGVTVLFAMTAFARVGVWSSNRRLWEDALRKAPHDVIAWNNHAKAVAESGDLELASRLFRHLTVLAPGKKEGWNNEGRVLFLRARAEKRPEWLVPAETALREALRIDPRYKEARNNLGLVLWEKGLARKDLVLLDKAASEFREALVFDPSYSVARENLDALNAQLAVLKKKPRRGRVRDS